MTAPDRDRSLFSAPGRYQPMSVVASCPAATGEARYGAGCLHFPDTAHRCGRDRPTSPDDNHAIHRCTCGFGWVSSPAA